jgi:hypothetical protein
MDDFTLIDYVRIPGGDCGELLTIERRMLRRLFSPRPTTRRGPW